MEKQQTREAKKRKYREQMKYNAQMNDKRNHEKPNQNDGIYFSCNKLWRNIK